MEGGGILFSFFVLVCLTQVAWGQQYNILADHGEGCNNVTLCDETKGLSCIYQKCSCLTGQGFEYNRIAKRCLGKVGAPCEGDSQCVSNAACQDLFCACKAGYSRSKNQYCQKSFGQTCTQDAQCNLDVHLICGGTTTNKTCTCTNNTNFMYTESVQQCTSRVDQPCDPFIDFFGFSIGRTGYRCVDSAECVRQTTLDDGGNPTYLCKCPSNLQVTENKLCAKKDTEEGDKPNGNERVQMSLLQILIVSLLVLAKQL